MESQLFDYMLCANVLSITMMLSWSSDIQTLALTLMRGHGQFVGTLGRQLDTFQVLGHCRPSLFSQPGILWLSAGSLLSGQLLLPPKCLLSFPSSHGELESSVVPLRLPAPLSLNKGKDRSYERATDPKGGLKY